MPGRVRARVEIKGALAFVKTELGGLAVVPTHTLCSLLRRFNIEPAWGDKVECPETVEVGARVLDVEDSGEPEEEP